MQFFITARTDIRVCQAIWLERMELSVSIHDDNSCYCCADVVYLIGNRHYIKGGIDMLKVVKRPKEYIAIKVPEDCEDIGKFVSKEAGKAGIRLDVTTYYAVGKLWATKVGVKNNEAKTVKRGSVIVCEISQDGSKYPEAVDVIGQEEFDKEFNPVDAKPLLAKLNEIEDGMFTKDEGMSLPDCANAPHVRIEFDDVNDVPHIWIDGKQVDKLPGNGLVSVDLNWHTRDQTLVSGENNHYKIEYLDLDGDKRVGIAQGNLPSNDLFKQ